MKKKWLVLIGVSLLFSLTFANKNAGARSVDPDVKTKTKVEHVKVDK